MGCIAGVFLILRNVFREEEKQSLRRRKYFKIEEMLDSREIKPLVLRERGKGEGAASVRGTLHLATCKVDFV
jgi:hypothetical protein